MMKVKVLESTHHEFSPMLSQKSITSSLVHLMDNCKTRDSVNLKTLRMSGIMPLATPPINTTTVIFLQETFHST